MTLTYYRPESYSRVSSMFENTTIKSSIIEVGQVVPEICHFLYFPQVTAAILDFGHYRCLKMCNLRVLFSSYPNKVKSITISLWASDSFGKYIPVYTTTSVARCVVCSRHQIHNSGTRCVVPHSKQKACHM